MKNICFFLFLLPQCLFAQTDIGSTKKQIRSTVEMINKEKKYTNVYLDQLQFSKNITDGGGSITGYFKNIKLVKVVRWIGLSYGFIVDEFYLDNDKLIFVHESENTFNYNDTTGEFDYDNIAVKFNGRYWFSNNKMIDVVSSGHNRFESDKADAEKDFLADIKNYSALLNKKLHYSKRK